MPETGMLLSGLGDFAITEDACAKINLALHVTGQRPDGFHLLEMLVTFARHGDRLGFAAADADDFTLSGQFADVLADDPGTNLVLKARDLLREAAGGTPPVRIHLEKNLPVASGIGGGSADAAATLRGLVRLWDVALPADIIAALALKLGADVPMCLKSAPLIARGIGEEIETADALPSFAMVLANPLKGVSTPEVFRRLATKNNPPLVLIKAPHWMEAIRATRNDLEPPARELVPEIAEISNMLTAEGALFTRMSGSGATCFGIFETPVAALRAAERLHAARPGWYFQATETFAGGA
ncbi:4-diphosphocytidyl-2-C-methyl-D-erythritol kinase [Rhizobium sp. BK316]|uniref:4-(cytidine 5'-diphospho)-2-C-methyl-D-erythritol kinase n=1 Tax=Rhizobium sp. BK316 TaxID=2587053 RepID=UPI00161791A4|nr:4-(cytidine 5'-diphospho)-2-C-methyl-D-erythritol kinase [Rhizobium sp. BK316]MBB3408621.1 4-diphosphocytidyl-2-C-methyl-D-erythritol kinase [Rhizobium sp. BK316]